MVLMSDGYTNKFLMAPSTFMDISPWMCFPFGLILAELAGLRSFYLVFGIGMITVLFW